MGLLDITLASDAVVGTNLRGGASGGGWLYCLPRLRFDTVVCLGSPSPATLAALVRVGTEVTVIAPPGPSRSRLRRVTAARGWSNVTLRSWRRSDGSPDSGGIDLLVIESGDKPPRQRAARLTSRLAVDGVACYPSTWTAAHPDRGDRVTLALTPAHGEARAFVPAGDQAMRNAFHALGLEGTVMRRPKLARWERGLLARLGHRHRARFMTLLGGPLVNLSGVPAYLRAIAAADDCRLDGWSYGVAARGEYDSQKVLVLLAPPGGTTPTLITKITRSEAFSTRLQNEASTLRQLAQLEIADGRAPKPYFSGFHAGRAVLGQSLMAGRPYQVPASRVGRQGHAQLAEAVGWLTELAGATAHQVPAADVAAVLLTLLARYEAVYAPTAGELAQLRAQFEALSGLTRPIPSVLQHGDPGIWNLLVDDHGRTVFLDWEAGEPDGMPLWDVLYLIRSHAIEVGRREGVLDRAEASVRHLTRPGPLADLLVDTIGAYCRRTRLPPEAVEPLILACWMHRALKEAARSSVGRLDEGLSVRLLRSMLSAPDAPVRTRLRRAGREESG